MFGFAGVWRVWGFGVFRVERPSFHVELVCPLLGVWVHVGFRGQGLVFGSRVQGLGFRVEGSRFRVEGSGFRVQGLGFGL